VIDPLLYKLKPMLATASTEIVADIPTYLAGLGSQWVSEIKFDGVRALLFIENGTVTLINRAGRDVTHRYPDVVAGVSSQFDLSKELVLDGELLVFDNGRPSWPLTAKRDAQSKTEKIRQYSISYPAVLMAFDCLWANGADLRQQPYTVRAAKMEASITLRGVVQKSLSSMNVKAMFEMVKSQNLEGIIVKDVNSPYLHKRTKTWIKVKQMSTVSVFVTKVEPGKGARSTTFGALHIAVLEADGVTVRPLGKVGTGFAQSDLDEVLFRLDAKQDMVMEVAFQEIGSGGLLRFPSWRGIRSDLVRADCTASQLPERVQ
jgi:bifunctional non-homologous end joining protein LigD